MTLLPKTLLIQTGVLLLGLFVLQTFPAQAQTSAKLYSLTISEADSIISELLSSAGLTIRQTDLDSGKIRISATDSKESWQILLLPHSALGVMIEVELYKGPTPLIEKVQTLWDDISEFQQKSKKPTKPQEQLIPSAILDQISSVVCLRAIVGQQHLQFSGFLIDNEGLILCPAHNLKAYEEVKVVFSTGLEYDGDIIKIDMHRDLALIKINATNESIISPGEGRNLLGMGEKIFSIGCPASLRGTIYPGSINSPPRRADDLPLWQVDMQIMPGSSGSPVFDSTGTFVAMVKGRYRGTERIGFLIPLETILGFLGEIQTQ